MIYDFVLLLRNPFLRSKALSIWTAWILATTIGWFFAGSTSLPIGRVVVVEGGASAILSVAGSMSLIGSLIGALASTGQWYFLRQRYSNAYLWLIATSAGWGIGLPLALMINLFFGLGISAGLYGLFVGAVVALLQWALFHRVIPRLSRWLPANMLAFALGISGAGWLERTMLTASGGSWGAQSWQTASTSALAGAIVGAITGIALTLMTLKKSNPARHTNA